MKASGYMIYNATTKTWLEQDEHTWGEFEDAAIFTDDELAEDIRIRETPEDNAGEDDTYVMGVMERE